MKSEIEKASFAAKIAEKNLAGLRIAFEKVFKEKIPEDLQWYKDERDFKREYLYIGWRSTKTAVDTNKTGLLGLAIINVGLEIMIQPFIYKETNFKFVHKWWGSIHLRWEHPNGGANGHRIADLTFDSKKKIWEVSKSN